MCVQESSVTKGKAIIYTWNKDPIGIIPTACWEEQRDTRERKQSGPFLQLSNSII